MALNLEIWQNDIVESLFKNNEFLNKAFNADQYVLQGKVVHIPQAGGGSAVKRNRTKLPATIVRRTDTEVTYALDEYTSDPILITNAETVELSYDKRQSVLSEDMNRIRESIAEWMLWHWSAESNYILPTTGVDVDATADGATGKRQALSKNDLKTARLRLNKLNVPREGRVATIPSEMLDQLLSDPDLMKRDNSMELDLKGGVVSRLYGFDLMERSTVLTYGGSNTVKNPDANTAATDKEAALFWHPDMVERALGEVSMFENTNDPTYYGDVYSFLVRMGGRKRRARGEGVISIVQATV